jgi:hypothetical protein
LGRKSPSGARQCPRLGTCNRDLVALINDTRVAGQAGRSLTAPRILAKPSYSHCLETSLQVNPSQQSWSTLQSRPNAPQQRVPSSPVMLSQMKSPQHSLASVHVPCTGLQQTLSRVTVLPQVKALQHFFLPLQVCRLFLHFFFFLRLRFYFASASSNPTRPRSEVTPPRARPNRRRVHASKRDASMGVPRTIN